LLAYATVQNLDILQPGFADAALQAMVIWLAVIFGTVLLAANIAVLVFLRRFQSAGRI
jgi:hypothetical protein